NPAGFPWTTLNINPEGSVAMRNRHHPITHAGFGYSASLIEYLLDKYKSEGVNLVSVGGSEEEKGMQCYKLILRNPSYKMISYTASEGETTLSIAAKLHINYISILDNNPTVSGTGYVKGGTVLSVPNDYASGMELLVRKDTLFPVRFKVYDEKGLFEDYSFYDLNTNPVYDEKDFAYDNPAYGFKCK
ncbi:MAG TPA: hypothetical protein VF857_02935, partial [Spirochaetota bacterium]